jgi:hypothetical protein
VNLGREGCSTPRETCPSPALNITELVSCDAAYVSKVLCGCPKCDSCFNYIYLTLKLYETSVAIRTAICQKSTLLRVGLITLKMMAVSTSVNSYQSTRPYSYSPPWGPQIPIRFARFDFQILEITSSPSLNDCLPLLGTLQIFWSSYSPDLFDFWYALLITWSVFMVYHAERLREDTKRI